MFQDISLIKVNPDMTAHNKRMEELRNKILKGTKMKLDEIHADFEERERVFLVEATETRKNDLKKSNPMAYSYIYGSSIL